MDKLILSKEKLSLLLIDTVYHINHGQHLHNEAADLRRKFSNELGINTGLSSVNFFDRLRDYYADQNILDDFIQGVHAIDNEGKVYEKQVSFGFNHDHQFPII